MTIDKTKVMQGIAILSIVIGFYIIFILPTEPEATTPEIIIPIPTIYTNEKSLIINTTIINNEKVITKKYVEHPTQVFP